MDSKIAGFFQTLQRFLDEQETKTETCQKTIDQIRDHEEQFSVCQKFDVTTLQLQSMNEKFKFLLLSKLCDRINDLAEKLSDNSTWFKSHAELLEKKMEKCLQESSDSEVNQFQAEIFTWMSEICLLVTSQSLKVEFLCSDLRRKKFGGSDKNQDQDESDLIFGHETANPKSDLTFKMSHGKVEKLNYYLDAYLAQAPKSKVVSTKSPQKISKKKT